MSFVSTDEKKRALRWYGLPRVVERPRNYLGQWKPLSRHTLKLSDRLRCIALYYIGNWMHHFLNPCSVSADVISIQGGVINWPPVYNFNIKTEEGIILSAIGLG